MIKFRASTLLNICSALVLALGAFALGGAVTAKAQQATTASSTPGITSPEEQEIEAAIPGIPPDLVKAVIAGTPADMQQVTVYLTSGAPDSHGILIRSLALVRAVGVTPAGNDEQVLLGVGLRLARLVQAYVETHSIVRVTVDRTYRPTVNARAFKFAAAGTEPPPGFELVAANDRRLEGLNIQPFHGPATDAVTGNGLTGVRCFSTAMQPGKYHVILLTADLGKPRMEQFPLGQDLTVNGQASKVVNADPSKWLTWAYLTNRQGGPAGAKPTQTSMLDPNDGVVVHQALPGAATRPGAAPAAPIKVAPRIPAVDVSSTSGGAFVTDTTLASGPMRICFDPPQSTVLVAAIFEAPTGSKIAGGGTNLARLEGPSEFPTSQSSPHGKPWRYMHRDGYTGGEETACKLLNLNRTQCEQYNSMVAAGACSVQLMPNGVVLTAMGYTNAGTHQSYAERNVLVDLKNPLSREVLLCKLGPGFYVGRAFGCNNPVRIEGADVSRPAMAAPIGPNMLVMASAADLAQRIARESEGLPFGGRAPGGPGGDPGVTIPPHSFDVSPG
jgi:hypothetical protein